MIKKNILFLVFIVTLVGICSSCLFPKLKRAQDIYYKNGQPENNIYYKIQLKELTVQKELNRSLITENATNIFNLLLNKASQEQEKKYSESENDNIIVLDAYVTLKEISFIKDYETLNTSTLEINLFKENSTPGGDAEIISLLTVNTKNTILSYKFLYALIERSLRRIYP